MTNEIPAVFHSGSNDDYRYNFIIKDLANEFEGQFEFLGETKKSKKLFLLQQKSKLQKLIKMVMKLVLNYVLQNKIYW